MTAFNHFSSHENVFYDLLESGKWFVPAPPPRSPLGTAAFQSTLLKAGAKPPAPYGWSGLRAVFCLRFGRRRFTIPSSGFTLLSTQGSPCIRLEPHCSGRFYCA